MPRRPLITERDVSRARREGVTHLSIGRALVTPSARDAAAKWGIALVSAEPGGALGRASTGAVRPASASGAPPGAPPGATGTATTTDRAGRGDAASPRVALGADHGGVTMKDAMLAYLRERGAIVEDHGTFGSEAVDYPDFALRVATAVAAGAADVGIMIDGAGIGSCMVANKVAGVRAAMCHDVTTATNAREHNNANLLTLGGSLLGPRLALEIVRTFLDTPFAGGRHARRVDKIDALDARAHDTRALDARALDARALDARAHGTRATGDASS